MVAADLRGVLAVLWAASCCFIAGYAAHILPHGHLYDARRLAQRTVDTTFAGISMFSNGSLSGFGLTSACEEALYQNIYCDDAVSSLSTDTYVGSFDNSTLTALVCDAGCEATIAQLHDAVAASCGTTAELVPGLPFLGIVDQLWSNWNQSCFTDPITGENCNDVIAAFPNVTDLSDLPSSDLCSYCNVQRLALLQEDAYSDVYNDDWQSTYEYVAQACNITVANFNATQSVFNVTVPSETPNCVSGNTYTTQPGDTCDSIALAHSVSAATMFYINANILNCSSILTGTTLCLPQSCASVYTVQANDTCSSIAANNGLLTQDVLSFNSQLNWNCTNLEDPNPYWGSTLCVSTPGGNYTGQALNTTVSTGDQVVDPPAGATVAAGTTTDCGAWFVNDVSLNLTCAQICLANEIAINLFTEANPSLNKTTCDTDLVAGDAYCVNPLTGWNWESNSSTNATTTTTTTTVSATAASTPGAPTQTGIAANCNAYYVAKANDTCAVVEAEFGITSAEFLAWNPAISSDCTSGFWAEEAYCVGISGSSTTAIATATTTSTSTSTSVVVPGPTQTGIPDNCSEYYLAQSGDDCATVEAKFGITDAEFHAWNPAVSSDCVTGFWADEAYCVAISS